MTGTPAPVWVVAGAPGAGKSTAAALLVQRMAPAPALLDKDTLYAGLVRATLDAAGRADHEREGQWYDDHVKVHEYGGMTAAAREIRGHGCGVMLVAPFSSERGQADRWERWVIELGGPPVRLVWVRADAATVKRRLVDRGRRADAGKLAVFDTWVARMAPDQPPPVAHVEIDNRLDGPPLDWQIDRLLAGRPWAGTPWTGTPWAGTPWTGTR